MKIQKEKTYYIKLYIAGNINIAEKLIQNYCDNIGLCVTILPLNYIYTLGHEFGMEIGFIDYPRFPTTSKKLFKIAKELGLILLKELNQQSFSLQTPYNTYLFNNKKEDNAK